MRNAILHQHKLSICVYTIILGIASITFSSCSTHRAIRLRNKSIKEWSAFQLEPVKKSKDDKWIIYSRKIKGTSFLEYQIEGKIETSSSECLASFKQDILNQASGLNSKKYPTYEIVSEANDSLLTYVIHNEPFPFKDTEMSVRYLFYDCEGKTEVSWHEAWDDSQVQPTKKLKRVETFRGSWSFVSTSDSSCQATNGVQFDPKKMPRWLFEPMVIKFLKEGLETIREAT